VSPVVNTNIKFIFIESGYVAPKNIRADELFYNSNIFSWPRALNNECIFYKNFAFTCRLVRTVLIRIPLNIIQKTFVYNKYLVLKGREVKLHQSISVIRSWHELFERKSCDIIKATENK
jgi:hypothetical protein